MLSLLEGELTCAIRMDAAMVEKLTFKEQVYALKELSHLGMIDHRDVEQTIIWYRIRCLTIA